MQLIVAGFNLAKYIIKYYRNIEYSLVRSIFNYPNLRSTILKLNY